MRPVDNFRTVEESLIEWLQKDPSRAEIFLSTELEEYTSDNDFEQLLHSLQCIAIAKGDTLERVDSSEVDQEGLDKLLQEDANPSWERVLEALDYASLESYGEPVSLH